MLKNLGLIYRLQKQSFHRTCIHCFLQITCLELTFCITEAQHVLLFDLWASKESFPTLPTMVRGALNATNICFEAVGEVELLSTVAARAQHMMDAGKQPDFSKLADLSAAGSVSAYAHVLGKFVQCFGGGPPWEAIKYLSTFSMVDKSVSLGKEYFQAVTEAEFSSTNMYPLLRLGLLCCNLTAPKAKIQDGFARLVSKSDVITCKSKIMACVLEDLEKRMAAAWKKALSSSPQANAFKAFGRFQVRSLLHILKKEKSGGEGASYGSLDEIMDLFNQELKNPEAQQVAASSASRGFVPSAMTMERAKNPMFLASLKLKLQVDEVCTRKNHPGKLFKITKVDENGVQIKFQDPVTSYEELIDAPQGEVVDMIKNAKGKIPQMMDDAKLESAFPDIVCHGEVEKSKAYLVLMECYNKLDCDSTYISVLSASRLFAKQACKKGDLVFVPVTSSAASLSFSKPKFDQRPTMVNSGGGILYIQAPKVFKEYEGKPPEGVIAPFFLVKFDEEKGNMKHEVIDFDGYKVTCLVNSKAIANGEEILACSKLDGSQPSHKKRKAAK